MRSCEFGGSHQEPSCGVRDELLNRWSRVRIPAPAPFLSWSIYLRHPTQPSCGEIELLPTA